MKLIDILSALQPLNPRLENGGALQEIEGKPEVDNRKLQDGDIFICIKGFNSDGHKFARDAMLKGARLLIASEALDLDAAVLYVSDTRKAAALMAKLAYGDPSSEMTLIGITGTNGKTTSSLLIYEALRALDYKVGWVGTLGYYIDGHLYETHHTTPDILELNKILADMRDVACTHVVMEVSSHAIALDRIHGLNFAYALFSNLSREHLDFHKTMEDYAATKFSFLEATARRGGEVLVNTDDAYGASDAAKLRELGLKVLTVGQKEADYLLGSCLATAQSSAFILSYRDMKLQLSSKLIGIFNIRNLALATATLLQMGIDPEALQRVLADLKPIKGRFQQVENTRGIAVYIDYAHSPDAIESILKSCKELQHEHLYCLVGAGGDRDKGKRPLMLQAALHNSDAVIITDDNPRSENPNRIVADMLTGTDTWFPWWVIRDRKLAIEAILKLACPGDIVVICGKGHENYQEIDGVRHAFDDYRIASDFLASSAYDKAKAEDELVLPLDRLMLELLMHPDDAPLAEKLEGYRAPQTYHFVSTDSRSIKQHSAFFAVKGERFDGNAYISDVLREPTVMAVGEIDFEAPAYLKAGDALRVLGDLCKKYLMMFPLYKIALTGSTGKTSSKELLAGILSEAGSTMKTLHNENNMVGLAKTILRVEAKHKYGVFELGTNHFGEIGRLSDICMPDSAIILNIGPSHLEFLIDEDGVFREKSALFNRSLQYRIYPQEDERFAVYKAQGLSVGRSEQADYCVSEVEITGCGASFKINQYRFELPYNVPHYVTNASFGIAMALSLGLEPELIQAGLSRGIKLDKRMEIKKLGDALVIVDCYNANPVSMQKAIEYWISLEPSLPHKAILGDMLELGEQGDLYHQMIGAMLSELNYQALMSVGELARHYAPESQSLEYLHFSRVEELAERVDLKSFCAGAVVLIKASHGIHLEKLLSQLGVEN